MWRSDTGAKSVVDLLAGCVADAEGRQRLSLSLAKAHWARVVGAETASHTAVLACSRGWLTVGVPNRAVEDRLERQRRTLFEAVSQLPDGRRIHGLAFRLAPMAEIKAEAVAPPVAPSASRARPKVDLERLTERQRAALEALDDEELRGVFAAWMSRQSEAATEEEA